MTQYSHCPFHSSGQEAGLRGKSCPSRACLRGLSGPPNPRAPADSGPWSPRRRLGVWRGHPPVGPAPGLEPGGEDLPLVPPAALGARALPEPRGAEPRAGDRLLPAAGEASAGALAGAAGRAPFAAAGTQPCAPPHRRARPRARRTAGSTTPSAPSSTSTLSPGAASAAAAGAAGWCPTRTRASRPSSSWRAPW